MAQTQQPLFLILLSVCFSYCNCLPRSASKNSQLNMKRVNRNTVRSSSSRKLRNGPHSQIPPVQLVGQPHEMNSIFGTSTVGHVFYYRPKQYTQSLHISKNGQTCPFSSRTDSQTKVKLVFRNATHQRLKLCWVDENGNLHHFYDIAPSTITLVAKEEEEEEEESKDETNMDVADSLDNHTATFTRCHVEYSFLGHAFVFLAPVENNNDTDEKKTKTGEESSSSRRYQIVAGYRPMRTTCIQKTDDKEPLLEQSTSTDEEEEEIEEEEEEEEDEEEEEEEEEDEEEPIMHLVTISRQCLSMTSLEDTTKRRSKPTFLRKRKDTPTDLRMSCWEYFLLVEEAHLDDTPYDTSNKTYQDFVWGGWPIKCEQGLFLPPNKEDKEDESGTSSSTLTAVEWICYPQVENGTKILQCQKRLALDLEAAATKIPAHALHLLKKCTPFYVNKTQLYGRKACPITNDANLCYHPDVDWLRKNGLSGDKCGAVELSRLDEYDEDVDLWYGLGGVLVHELAHAWHHKFVPGGFDNEEIISCYKLAMKEKLYDVVKCHTGPISSQPPTFQLRKAYACQDHKEYFAELSTAFLGGVGSEATLEYNKWFPFNRMQVKEHDPRAYAMLQKMWGVSVDDERVSSDVDK